MYVSDLINDWPFCILEHGTRWGAILSTEMAIVYLFIGEKFDSPHQAVIIVILEF